MENKVNSNAYKILVADDYPVNRTIYKNLLSFEGYTVLEATNGKEVVDLYEKEIFDLIIMDLHMPVMNGAEATQLIRSSGKENARSIPIIVLTGDSEMVNKKYFLDLGFSDYLPKPIDRDGLLNIVRTNLKQSSPINNIGNSEIVNMNSQAISNKSINTPLNLEKAFYDFDNNKELFLTIVQKFLSLLTSQTKLIRNAIKQNDFSIIKEITHSIKGSAGNIYANQLMEAAANLERQAKPENLDKLNTEFKTFQDEKEKLEVYFKEVMNNVHGLYN